MATFNKVEEVGCYRIDVQGNMGWFPIRKRTGVPGIIKFKTIEDAVVTRMRMGLPKAKTRIIDEIRGRKVI